VVVELVEPPCGRVVFVTTLEHELQRIEVIAATGGPISPVTTTAATELGLLEFPAAVRPDGRMLVVLASRPGVEGQTLDELGLLDLASLPGTPEPIGPHAQLRNPSFSPGGRWLVFESNAESFRDLYRLDLASGAVLRLTNDANGNFEPSVSPDGQRIAFVSSRDGNAEIYVMSADGGDARRLTSSPGDDSAPIWSPEGQTIAFTSGRDRARGIDVFVMDGEGAGQRALVDDPIRAGSVHARDLAFSPDGRRLAFTQLVPSSHGGGVVIVAVDTGKVLAHTGEGEPKPSETRVDEQPAWSPDGRHLVFSRSHGERSAIVRIRSDGSELELLTEGDGVHWLPRWIPDPKCPRVAPVEAPAAASGRG
jgi:TolB protein